MKKTIITLAILFLQNTSFAEFTQQKCSRVLTHSGDVQIQRDYDEVTRNCFISIHPMSVSDLKYRDFYFNNDGLFMVFNSYGEGNSSSTTATRSFYLFPKLNDYPDFSIEENGDVLVKTVSDHYFLFDAKAFKIKSVSPGSFTEKPLSKNNKGGVEIKLISGFWLDVGFKMGGMAEENKKGTTVATGSKKGQCTLKNTDLFDYSQAANYEYSFLYEGEAMSLFLKNRCQIQF